MYLCHFDLSFLLPNKHPDKLIYISATALLESSQYFEVTLENKTRFFNLLFRCHKTNFDLHVINKRATCLKWYYCTQRSYKCYSCFQTLFIVNYRVNLSCIKNMINIWIYLTLTIYITQTNNTSPYPNEKLNL